MSDLKKNLSQETLKLIACTTMLCDHAAVIFGGSLWFRVIGRLAFPIYCFLLTEGIRYTRSTKRYLLRVLAAALLSEPVYDFVLYPGAGIWQHQNVLWTLLLGCLLLCCIQKTDRPWCKLLLVIPFALAAQLMRASYGGSGILMIALFGLSRGLPEEKWIQLAGLLGINWLLGGISLPVLGLEIPVQLFAVLAMIPVSLYSGEKKTKSRVFVWGFYLFYPAHLLMLWAVAFCLSTSPGCGI